MILFALAILAAPTSGAPRIIVDGFGSVKAVPDVATLSFDVDGEGKTSDAAVASLAAKSRAVESALRSMDPTLELHSASVRVKEARGTACKGDDDYGDREVHLSSGACAIEGYVASQDFDVRTTHVSDAGTMVGLAGRRGASDPRINGFNVSDTTAARKEAIARALGDARSKAQAIADASKVKLGEPRSVNLDNAQSRALDVVVSGRRVQGLVGERDEPPINIDIKPEPVEVTARVTVEFEILR